MLKLFSGFSLDMASDFTGLRPGEIDWLRQQGIVAPKKKASRYVYTFTDLLVLRLVRRLKINDIRVSNVKKAKNYLGSIDPEKSLINVTLYIGARTGQIYYIGEEPQQDVMVSITQQGQLVRKDFVWAIPIGKDLERVRKEIISLDKDLSERIAKPKPISLEAGLKKYGLA